MIIRRSSINIAQDHKNHHDDRTPLSSCRFSFFQRHSTTNLKSSMDDLQANPSPLDPSRLNDRCFNVAMTTSGCSRLETSFSRRSVFLDETWSDKMPRERRSIGSYSMMARRFAVGSPAIARTAQVGCRHKRRRQEKTPRLHERQHGRRQRRQISAQRTTRRNGSTATAEEEKGS